MFLEIISLAYNMITHLWIFLVGIFIGWGFRSYTSFPPANYIHFGTVRVDSLSSSEKDLMAFEFSKSPSSIKDYHYIYFDVDSKADLSMVDTMELDGYSKEQIGEVLSRNKKGYYNGD